MGLSGVSSLFLFAVCVYSCLSGTNGYYYRSSSGSNAQELRKMREEIQILTNEVSRLADASSDKTDTETPPLEPVTLLSIERTPGPDGNVYTLNFTQNIPEIYYVVTVYDRQIAKGQDIEHYDGYASLVYPCTDLHCKNAHEFDLYISSMDRSTVVRFKLDNEGTEEKFQADFTVPTLVIKNTGDLVYDARRDVNVEFSASYGVGENSRYSDVSSYLKVVADDGWTFGREPSDAWVKETEQRKFLDTEETTLTVKTSERQLSGFLILALTFTDREAPLVKELEVLRSLVLRPRGQRGPFPDGFLTFPEFSHGGRDLSTNTMCKVGDNCTFSCLAVGGSMTQFNVDKLKADGGRDPVELSSEFVMVYERKVEWTVHPTVDSEDMTFECVALTESSNISSLIHVAVVSEEFYIDENRTSLEVTDPVSKNLTLNCTIVGRPLFGAYFVLEVENEQERYTYMDYFNADTVSLSPGETLATREIDFGTEDYDPEEVLFIYCLAESYAQRLDRHVMFGPFEHL